MPTKLDDTKHASSALRDCWTWKDAVYRETADLNTADTLARIHEKTTPLIRDFGLHIAAPHAPAIGERAGKYTTENDDSASSD